MSESTKGQKSMMENQKKKAEVIFVHALKDNKIYIKVQVQLSRPRQ